MSQVCNAAVSVVTGSLAAFALGALVFAQATAPADKSVPFKSTMANPYRLVENWPKLGSIPPGPAIGIIPDEQRRRLVAPPVRPASASHRCGRQRGQDHGRGHVWHRSRVLSRPGWQLLGRGQRPVQCTPIQRL